MVDVVADIADSMVQDVGAGSAALAGAGVLAGSRERSRSEVSDLVHQHNQHARTKLVAANAFSRAGAHKLPAAAASPTVAANTGSFGLPKTGQRLVAPWESPLDAPPLKTPRSPRRGGGGSSPADGSSAISAQASAARGSLSPLRLEQLDDGSPTRGKITLPALIPSPAAAQQKNPYALP